MKAAPFDRRSLMAGGGGIIAGASFAGAALPNAEKPQSSTQDTISLSVRDFGALGDGRADDNSAVNAALAEARQLDFLEKRIVFPTGKYNINQVDLTGTRNISLVAEGTVHLTGTGGGDFIIGAERYARPGDDGSVYNFKLGGGHFFLSAALSANYRHALQLYGFVQSNFSALSISGEFGRGEAERAAVTIDRSWVNRFEGLSVACPGDPGSGRRSIAIRSEIDNVNVNTFDNCRIVGVIGQPKLSGTIGIVLNGVADRVVNCDISAIEIGIELKAARGCMLAGNYHEMVRRAVVARRGNSRGCTIVGGFYSLDDDSTALSLGSSQSTTVIGGYFRGTGGGTFIDMGEACYGLSVIEPTLEDVGTAYKGIERGALTDGAKATRISAGQLVFPGTAVPSPDPRTLDDYHEGLFVPRGNGFVFVDGTAGFTKIGNVVHVRFNVRFPPSSSSAEAAVVNLPYSAATGQGAGVVLGHQRNPDGNALAVRDSRLVVIDPRTGRTRTNAEVAGNVYSGVATYAVAS